MTVYYKVLNADRSAYHGGTGKWPQKNRWLEVDGPLEPCKNGLHVCTRDQLVGWLGPAIWRVEVDGEIVDACDKTVVRRARLVERLDRWDERTARLFAADCADRALRLVAKSTGQKCDPRSRAAVRAAREFAEGRIGVAELAAARAAAVSARDAAWAAAVSARDAAWAAAVSAREAAWAAAGAAARAAAVSARDAAWAAAGAAARAAERQWQTKRLFEYLDGKRGVK